VRIESRARVGEGKEFVDKQFFVHFLLVGMVYVYSESHSGTRLRITLSSLAHSLASF
jgi:hypothetical protein